MVLVQTLLTETFGKILTHLFIGVFSYCTKCVRTEQFKMTFDSSEEIVWILYYQLCLWTTMIFFPYIALLQPLFVWILFLSYYMYLKYICIRPISESNKETTGSIISTLSFASLMVWIVSYILLLVYKMPHYNWISNKNR